MKRNKAFYVLLLALPLLVLGGCYKPKFDLENITEEDLNPGGESGQTDYTTGANPYISRVVEYCPAPGQFVNKLPEIKAGDTEEKILQRCTEALANNAQGMIHLGGFGGYITLAFDHSIKNREGRDFMIHGNAFRADQNKSRGNSEPGAVMVMQDKNGNGIPDDGEWYELKGAGYDLPETTKNYEITYYRPDPNKPPVTVSADPNYRTYLVDAEYIKWVDNQRKTGYIEKNVYHDQSYWPLNRLEEETITFRGTRLNDVLIDESGVGRYYTQKLWEYGYADNLPNSEELGFDIAWAIDGEGNPVELESIDFVRIYCCVNEQAGWIGELSTEIVNAWDLNLLNEDGKPHDNTYLVIYNANGGAGQMSHIRATVGKSLTLPKNTFSKEGFTFQGWARTADATEPEFQDEQSVDLGGKQADVVTLYAVWK